MGLGGKVMFYLVIVDEDKKKFNVVGTRDDTKINEEIVKLQKQGRQVRCFNPQNINEQNLFTKAKEYEDQTGYEFVTESVLR